MIVDLTGQELPPELWGNKAARLSRVARLGYAVPPAICFQPGVLATEDPPASLSSWLSVYRPNQVIVRTSSVNEDTTSSANAGRTVSVAGCPPDAVFLVQTIQREVLPFLAQWTNARGAGVCVMVQEQVQATVAGVAFLSGERLDVELSAGSTSAVTAGAQPGLHVVLGEGAVATAEENGLGTIPVMAITEALRRTCWGLRDVFGFDLDVEWAWLAGAVVTLQIRPVTVAVRIVGQEATSWTS